MAIAGRGGGGANIVGGGYWLSKGKEGEIASVLDMGGWMVTCNHPVTLGVMHVAVVA